MAVQINKILVFISSPSGFEEERKVIEKEIERFNKDYEEKSLIGFKAIRWESAIPGKIDPQYRINGELDDCDFFLLLLHNMWGSKTRDYTSGTEEEFIRAKKLCDDSDANMKDISLLFKAVSKEQLLDPGPQLSKVLEFKKEIEDKREFLYKDFEVNNSYDDFESLIHRILLNWHNSMSKVLGKTGSLKESKKYYLDIRDTGDFGRSLFHASWDRYCGVRENHKTHSLAEAENFALEGKYIHAEEKYTEACREDQSNIWASLRYGRFLRKIGQKRKAEEIIIKSGELSSILGESFYEAYSLHQIGKLHRLNGDKRETKNKYLSAIPLYEQSGDNFSLGNLYVDLGLCYTDLKEHSEVEGAYKAALSIFNSSSDYYSLARVNQVFATYYRKRGFFDKASDCIDHAIEIFENNQPSNVHEMNSEASCYYEYSVLNRFLLNFTSALEYLEKSKEIYRKTNNDKMQERVEFEKAIVYQRQNRFDEAEQIFIKQLMLVEKYGSSWDITIKKGAYISFCVSRYVMKIASGKSLDLMQEEFNEIQGMIDKQLKPIKGVLDIRGKGIHLSNLGKLLCANNQFSDAITSFTEAKDLLNEDQSKYEEYEVDVEFAKALIAGGSVTEGINHLSFAKGKFKSIGVNNMVLEIERLLEAIEDKNKQKK